MQEVLWLDLPTRRLASVIRLSIIPFLSLRLLLVSSERIGTVRPCNSGRLLQSIESVIVIYDIPAGMNMSSVNRKRNPRDACPKAMLPTGVPFALIGAGIVPVQAVATFGAPFWAESCRVAAGKPRTVLSCAKPAAPAAVRVTPEHECRPQPTTRSGSR